MGALGNPVTLSDAGQNASEPELAVNQAGQGVIAWRRFDGDDFRAEGMTMATTKRGKRRPRARLGRWPGSPRGGRRDRRRGQRHLRLGPLRQRRTR